ncbi:hypothetical protein Zmor_015240 [Zophobas morio]|uniref:VWFC domain-containing protein n=1 Tax=Zophobas morio TaxID=2755281 RepID=A0AA38ILT0_9CUCU|nr:hypothetical protein Zmor_015240 [Zophobas morio]
MMMFISVFFFGLVATLASATECDELGILIYEDLGCVPEYGNDTECPLRYVCKGLERSPSNCYFRGKSYKDREQVDSSLTNPSCDEGCFCTATDEGSSFICAVLDCPENLGDPVRHGCYRSYSLDHCCSIGQKCPPFDNTEKCEVEGTVYKEGEMFYPSDTCLNCVCGKGFEGKFEAPFCKRRSCGQQLRNSGGKIQASCAPVYGKKFHKKDLCCPDDWICPNETETIEGDAKSEETCKFGEKEIKVGQYFERLNFEDSFGFHHSKIKCECVIPPLMKCTDVA